MPKLEGKAKENYLNWLGNITKMERKQVKNVIRGKPAAPNAGEVEETPGSIKAGPIYSRIPIWRYESYKRQFRPMNSRFIELITMDHEEAENLSYEDRVNYKMGVYQLLNNINFISARFQLEDVRGQIPTSMIKNRLLKFYH